MPNGTFRIPTFLGHSNVTSPTNSYKAVGTVANIESSIREQQLNYPKSRVFPRTSLRNTLGFVQTNESCRVIITAEH